MQSPPKATKNNGKDKRIANLKPFKAGQSGNPGGRPKNKPITELYERLLSDPKNIAAIEKAVLAALLKGNMAMVLLLREITERIEGKVVQSIEADITMNLAEAMAEGRKRAAMKADAK